MSNLPEVFRPHPEYIPQIMKDVRDPSIPLQHVADRLGTSIESLCIWLSLPHISQMLDQYECACARRIGLIIADQLPTLINMVNTIVTNVHAEERRLAAETPNPRNLEARRSARRLALNAIRLLTRFARFKPASKSRSGAPNRIGAGNASRGHADPTRAEVNFAGAKPPGTS